MATNKLKVMLNFMKEINGGNIPKYSDYGLEKTEFYNIIDSCQKEGLIEGAAFSRGGRGNKILIAYLEDTKLTVKGEEYLDEHSVAMKAYKGLKELRDWLPF